MVWGSETDTAELQSQLKLAGLVMVEVLAPPRVQLAKALLETSAVKLPAPLGALFFFNDPATTEIYTLPLHDALPISGMQLTSVLVSCLRAVTTKAPELPRWLASPP